MHAALLQNLRSYTFTFQIVSLQRRVRRMFKYFAYLMVLVLLQTFLPLSQANACIRQIPREAVLDRYVAALEAKLGIAISESAIQSISKPQLMHLRPLQPDCRGLAFAFYISKFRFAAAQEGRQCLYDGTILLKGVEPTAEIDVHYDLVCRGSGLEPTPPTAGLASLAGVWMRTGAEGALARIVIDSQRRTVRVFGSCGGGECPWGEQAAPNLAADGSLTVQYLDASGETTLRMRLQGEHLEVHMRKIYQNAPGRPLEMTEYFRR